MRSDHIILEADFVQFGANMNELGELPPIKHNREQPTILCIFYSLAKLYLTIDD